MVKGALQTPNVAEIRIYNPAPETAAKIKDEFARVWLEAGYQGGRAIIFQGNIKQTRYGRESQVDTFLDIYAADGDEAYNRGVVSQTLAAGYTPADVHAAICTAMDPYGTKPGDVSHLPAEPAPRGRVLYGMARDHGRVLAHSHDAELSIQDGEVHIMPRKQSAPSGQDAIVLTSETGLLGMPQQTQGGIMARCLLNPRLRVANVFPPFRAGSLVRIDQASVQRAAYNLGDLGRSQLTLPSVTRDGLYRVLFLAHVGDTRGSAWFTELTLAAVHGTPPTNTGSLSNVQGH